MKRLTLVRHAKSSWELEELSDSWRPLNERGYRQLAAMAGREPMGGVWLVSPAVRAYSTAYILREQSHQGMEAVRLASEVYDNTLEALLGLLRRQRDEHLVVVGHNPGMETLAGWLLGSPIKLATCSVLELELAGGEWDGLEPACATQLSLFQPEREND